MKRKIIGFVFVTVFLFGMAFLRPAVTAQSGSANQAAASKPPGEKTAGETYKNIQALTDLKDAPASEFNNTMQFISGALSVSCNYCHAGPFESDAKKTKLMARDMIKMTRAINESNFGGRQVVTCNTCHQGNPHPTATPTPWYKTPEQIAAYNKSVETAGQPKPQPTEATAALPDVDQVMANYRKAVGAGGLKSIRTSGTIAIGLRPGVQPFEFYAVSPGKFLLGNQAVGVQLIVNGDHGWRVTPQARTPLPPGQLAGARDTGEVFLPVRYERSETPRKVTGIEKIGDRAYYVVESHTAKGLEQAYFDVQSGLLYKIRVENETRLGPRVDETTFEDYRDVNGAKIAYQVTIHYMTDQILYKTSEAQINLDVDPAKFEPPAPPELKTLKVDPKILDSYVGEYQSPSSVFTVSREGDRFFVTQRIGQAKLELFAENETDFLVREVIAKISFIKNDKGQVIRLVLHQGGADVEMPKIK